MKPQDLLPCPCCGRPDPYSGTLSAFSRGIHCFAITRAAETSGCGLKVERHFPDIWEGEGSLNDHLDRLAAEAWNKRSPVVQGEAPLSSTTGELTIQEVFQEIESVLDFPGFRGDGQEHQSLRNLRHWIEERVQKPAATGSPKAEMPVSGAALPRRLSPVLPHLANRPQPPLP